MKCPRDTAELAHEPFGIKAVLRCGKCTGVFVPARTVDELYGFARISSHRHAKPAVGLTEARLGCPNDGRQMMELNYKGVNIDVCVSCHGIWLDGDEVGKILSKAKTPRDNLLELDRRMENLENGLESLEGVSNIDLGDLGAVGDTLRFLGDAAGMIADALSSIDISL